ASTDLATASALRAFGLATEAVSGRATHQILGGPSGLPDDFYRRLRVELGVRHAAPIVDGDVGIADRTGAEPAVPRGGRRGPLLRHHPVRGPGLPPVPRSHGARAARARGAPARAADVIGRPGTALIAPSTAGELGVAIGQQLAIETSGHRRALTIVGLLQPADPTSARALDGLLVTDIATAQETLGAVGRLSRVDLIVGDDAAGPALLAPPPPPPPPA